jgi:hypothetical protein
MTLQPLPSGFPYTVYEDFIFIFISVPDPEEEAQK